jgi:LuxR family quorum sensing-dependent transcriptional regulator
VLAHSWPSGFFEDYARGDYIAVDPVALRARGSSMPFAWHEGAFEREAEPRGLQVMRDAAEAGIACGFSVPIHTPSGYAAIVSMSGPRMDLPDSAQPGLHLMALYAYERLKALCGSPARVTRPRLPLTVRECEVLTWVARGKTAWDVGELLGIAKRTVDEHAQTAARKLGAANRTQAVAIALRDGIIRP